MFVTHPRHEFPVPKGLADPGSQHWRLIELVLHVPWFLITLAAVPEENEAMLTQSWCLAWERDLVHLLTTIDTSRVIGLTCMIPGWASKAHQWTSKEVGEVWLARSNDEQDFMQLIDFDGNAFEECSKVHFPDTVVERRLLLRMRPAHSSVAR